jgi:hypothetical protein
MSGQNRSSAVMQQRSEPHDSLDDFPTPPWATRALCEWLTEQVGDLGGLSCREPCANRGFMVRPLSEFFGAVLPSDVHDYGAGFPVEDFLFPGAISEVDFTCMNPPFRLAEEFVHRALATSRIGCAAILRSAFLEGKGRFDTLFSLTPPSFVLQFAERVPMCKGRVDPEIASATAYAWLVWLKGGADTRLRWIAPCRKRLERPSDYEVAA